MSHITLAEFAFVFVPAGAIAFLFLREYKKTVDLWKDGVSRRED